MKKKLSALTALALICAMVLTACSGGGSTSTTAAAAETTAAGAAAETTAAAAPSGETVKMTMGTGGTTGTYYAFGGVMHITEPTSLKRKAQQQSSPRLQLFTQRFARLFLPEILNLSQT